VRVLTAHPDERILLSSGKDASVRVWAPEGGTSCVAIYKGHREPVTHMSVVAARDWVCSSDSEMHVFDLESQHKVHSLRGTLASGHVANFTATLALSPLKASPTSGGMVMVGSTAKYPGPVAIKVVDLRSPSRALEWHLPPSVNDASVLAQGQACLWVGSNSGQICQLDLRSGLVRRCWQGHQGAVSGLLPRPAALISASADKTVAVWRVESCHLHTSRSWDLAWASTPLLSTWAGKEAASRLYLTDPVVALDSIGSKMAAAVAGGVVLADAPHSVSQSRLRHVRSSVVSMVAMPYSRTLFIGCEDGKIRCCY